VGLSHGVEGREFKKQDQAPFCYWTSHFFFAHLAIIFSSGPFGPA